MLGLLAGPGYVVVSLTQALTREGFDLTRHAWSLLANGDLGWIQMTNLIITGLLVIAGALGLRRILRPGIGSTWPPRLLAGYGLSMIAAGIFRADPALGFPVGTPADAATMSWHGLLHFGAGAIGFSCLAAACFGLARRFTADRRRGWAAFSRTTGVLFLAGFVAMAAGGGHVAANLAFTAAMLLAWAWLSSTMWHHRSSTTH
ncbi:DUF998 domain-containing protein [Micromonospora fiedleri]|uniref:DUF998 domain-containing protein n=2 Tax=Micromonosporaceae TaxID=28056 RepID=A0ABS1UU50_9ACTN|nr:DUF998 domain-containing protein [Micromonospora fiedleri]